MNTIKGYQANVIKTNGKGVRLVKYGARYYTLFGSLFAVAGDQLDKHNYQDCALKMTHYGFRNWEKLIGLYRED